MRSLSTLSITLAAVTLLALTAMARPAQATPVLVTRDAAVAHGPMVQLGEIAEPLVALDPQAWKVWSRIELWPAPEREGRSQAVHPDQVKAALKKALGEQAAAVAVAGPITVQRGGGLLTAAEIRTELEQALAGRLATFPGRTELRDLQAPEATFLDRAAARVEFEGLDQAEPGRNSFRVQVLDAAGLVLRKLVVAVFIDCWAQVPVAARPLRAGETVTPDLVSFAEKNMAYQRGEIWNGRGFPVRVLRTVGEGFPIMADNIDALPTVARGATVTLEYRGRNIHLSVPAEVMADGRVGQRIEVRNLESDKRVVAVVVDADTVQVQ